VGAVGEATHGEEDVILLGEEGRRRSGRRSAGHPRTTAVVHGENVRGPSGRRRRSTGRRSGALTDDGGALVEVSGALLEDGGVVEGTATLGDDGGGAWWQILAA
jgi:hypothetical protein